MDPRKKLVEEINSLTKSRVEVIRKGALTKEEEIKVNSIEKQVNALVRKLNKLDNE